ncbi:MAG: cytoplasmic iron level regulating protein YaaA (DUF328/UPF0246 family) [Flavobacterium sp.]|jgi:cytoplasmic iron level regulating protein YaaA (DUF328/UPF0246 family)
MKILISPAKSLDFKTQVPTDKFSNFSFLDYTLKVEKVLKKQTKSALIDLMSISEKLADLNLNRNKERNLSEMNVSNARQALFAFNGDVYSGLDACTLNAAQIEVAQQKLRILSGLYGILKPLDLMQPYRLEMGTQLKIGTSKNLHSFWKKQLTESLNAEMKEEDLLINLASKEYFGALDSKKLKAKLITPEFKDFKNGKLKIISFFAKKARGLMVRYILDTNCKTIADLKGFNYDGYLLDTNLSTNTNLVFTR